MRIMARTLHLRERTVVQQPVLQQPVDQQPASQPPAGRPLPRGLSLVVFCGLGLLAAGPVRAQTSPSPNQPLAIPDQVRMGQACPLIVPRQDYALQPLRIPPAQVPAKNAMGCLSPADALYGPDGCPTKLCKEASGTVSLPGY